MKATAVIPFKLQGAKSRLSPLLSPKEREELALVMLEDVLKTVNRNPALMETLLVSSSNLAAKTAKEFGAEVLLEESVDGLNPAVEKAIEQLMAEGRSAMLVIPADIPLLLQGDLQAILSMNGGGPAVVVSPSGRDGGTNGLLLKPPNAIRPLYGAESFQAHVKEALAKGIASRVYRSSTIGLDIDTPEDLGELIVRRPGVGTYGFVVQRGFDQRLRGLLHAEQFT